MPKSYCGILDTADILFEGKTPSPRLWEMWVWAPSGSTLFSVKSYRCLVEKILLQYFTCISNLYSTSEPHHVPCTATSPNLCKDVRVKWFSISKPIDMVGLAGCWDFMSYQYYPVTFHWHIPVCKGVHTWLCYCLNPWWPLLFSLH